MPDVDFIIVTKNQFDYTERCIESIFRHAHRSFQMIVVDNASTDRTRSYLAEVKSRETDDQKITLVLNDTNNGYALGLNQGLEFSLAPFVLFCNNDIEFFPGALQEMIATMDATPEFGLVNPNSNEFGLSGYDASLIEAQKGKWIERCHTSGFCVLVKRAVLQKIGGIDPTFGPAYFEDMDFAERAKRAGFLCAVAKGAYVHHFGTRTFLPKEKQALWDSHKKLFAERWGGTKWFVHLGQNEVLDDAHQRQQVVKLLLHVARTEIAVLYILAPRKFRRYFEGIHDSFRVLGVPETIQPIFFLLKAWRSRRQKPISRIYVSDKHAARFWKQLQFFHRATVHLLSNAVIAS